MRRCRWGLFAPGIIGLAIGALIFFLITDDPETAGFAPVEAAPVKKGALRALPHLGKHFLRVIAKYVGFEWLVSVPNLKPTLCRLHSIWRALILSRVNII